MKREELLLLKITKEGETLDFSSAKRLADELASSTISEPMVIAWYDGIKGEEHPQVKECQHKPGWLAYAEGHDGRLRIDVNENQYSFIYTGIDEPEE